MPYVVAAPSPHPAAKQGGPLLDRLVDEFANPSPYGQPVIVETRFEGGRGIELRVFWDEWQRRGQQERRNVVLSAYRSAIGDEYAARVALLEASTFEEGWSEGSLPFEVLPLLRKTDAVGIEECHAWMEAVGASTLFERPRLLFPTAEMAEECRVALVKRHPEAAEVWAVVHSPSVSGGAAWGGGADLSP